MPYLNVVEVESALQLVAATHPGFTELVTLPHLTWENRVCRAVRVAADLATARPTVVLVAGVHAREWGGPDILVSFLDEFQSEMAFGVAKDDLAATLEQEAQPIVSGEYAQILTTEEGQIRRDMERRAEKLTGGEQR